VRACQEKRRKNMESERLTGKEKENHERREAVRKGEGK
jgi:hypothetical protein